MTEKLRGVDLTRVNRKHLTLIVKRMKLPSDTSIESMTATLSDHLMKLHKLKPDELLGCDFCGGSSDLTFEVCPYCGKSDTEATAALAAAAPAADAKPLVNARAAKVPKPPKATLVNGPSDANPGPVKPKVAKLKPPAADKPGLAKVHAAELVDGLSVIDLDASVAEIKQLQVDIVDNHWVLGQKLAENYDKNLHKLRVNESGKPKYASWGQWVEAEIGFSPRYALDLAGVSRAFTQQDIKEVGVTKLRVLARIPDEAKKQNLLARAKQELVGGKPLTRNQLTAEATKDGPLPPRKGIGAANQRGGSSPEIEAKRVATRAATAAAKAEAKGVTAVIQMGRVTLPLFNGKESKNGPVRAFALSDEPQAVEDLLNGIKVRYSIVKEQDGLHLVVERVRE